MGEEDGHPRLVHEAEEGGELGQPGLVPPRPICTVPCWRQTPQAQRLLRLGARPLLPGAAMTSGGSVTAVTAVVVRWPRKAGSRRDAGSGGARRKRRKSVAAAAAAALPAPRQAAVVMQAPSRSARASTAPHSQHSRRLYQVELPSRRNSR